MKKRLISSYDEINDTFVGKIEGENGYCADYGISEGIFLGINKDNFPTSVFVLNASEVFDISKEILECPDVRININCNDLCVYFDMFIEGLKICSIKFKNNFGIPNLNYLIDCNM